MAWVIPIFTPKGGSWSLHFWCRSSLFIDLLSVIGLTKNDKDLEIIIIRQQVRILQRKISTSPRISDHERMILATLIDKFSHSKDHARQRLHEVMFIFKPTLYLTGIETWYIASEPSNIKEIQVDPGHRLNFKPWLCVRRKRTLAGAMKRYTGSYSNLATI